MQKTKIYLINIIDLLSNIRFFHLQEMITLLKQRLFYPNVDLMNGVQLQLIGAEPNIH